MINRLIIFAACVLTAPCAFSYSIELYNDSHSTFVIELGNIRCMDVSTPKTRFELGYGDITRLNFTPDESKNCPVWQHKQPNVDIYGTRKIDNGLYGFDVNVIFIPKPKAPANYKCHLTPQNQDFYCYKLLPYDNSSYKLFMSDKRIEIADQRNQ